MLRPMRVCEEMEMLGSRIGCLSFQQQTDRPGTTRPNYSILTVGISPRLSRGAYINAAKFFGFKLTLGKV